MNTPESAVEAVAKALFLETERWRQRNPRLAEQETYPYDRLIVDTKNDLEDYARAAIDAYEKAAGVLDAR